MGVSSRIGSIAWAKQSGKGAAAAAPVIKCFLAAQPSLAVAKNRSRFSMTDAGRDQGGSFTTGMSVAGDFQVYMHFDAMATLAYYAQGTNVDTGAVNFTHTSTPAADLPWVTFWYMRGGASGIVEKYVDCKVNSLQIESTAGQPLTATIGIIGIDSIYTTPDTVLAALTSQPLIYPEFCNELKVDTVAQKLHSLNFGIDNGLQGHQSDCYTFDDVDPGPRTYSLNFACRFTGPSAFPDYKTWVYGAGTTLTPAVGVHAFNAKAVRNVNSSFEIDLDAITYASMPVHASPDGAPIDVEVACEVETPAAGTICTLITKDQTATVL